ncbi:MAG: ketoacyl-ACP synthase III [Chloroflexi bacterium]|nr:ketoacyl-ACP synthase III [Chloroflexota bacterium]MBP8058714.1 ketoacyl-ACP synthase III [Chloroflexota bacterium]
MLYAHIAGWGRFLPNRILTNDEISHHVETDHEWIYSRTGISERRVAQGETTATMAFEAAARALARADLHPSQVELIIVATSTPEYMFPATACLVQDYLGATKAGAFDLSAACSGFVYGMSMAASAIQTGSVRNAIVIGSERLSRVLDWTDRGTCILFGDGAGAVVLKRSHVPGGVLATTLRSDGSGGDMLSLPNIYHNPNPYVTPEFSSNGHRHNTISMNGRQVFRFATNVVPEIIEETLAKANLTLKDVNLIIPHQANVRIVETVARKLGVPDTLFYTNMEYVGNTSAASIPIALSEAVKGNRLRPDDVVLFVGFGGGLTWAASVVRWDVPIPEVTLLDREWRRAKYVWARGRSQFRRFLRRMEAKMTRSPKPEPPRHGGE